MTSQFNARATTVCRSRIKEVVNFFRVACPPIGHGEFRIAHRLVAINYRHAVAQDVTKSLLNIA